MNCCQPSGRSGAVMEMAGTPGAMTCESFPTCTVREYAGSHARSFRQDTPAPAVTGPSLVTIARAAGRGCTSEVATAFYNRGLPCPPRGPTNGFHATDNEGPGQAQARTGHLDGRSTAARGRPE